MGGLNSAWWGASHLEGRCRPGVRIAVRVGNVQPPLLHLVRRELFKASELRVAGEPLNVIVAEGLRLFVAYSFLSVFYHVQNQPDFVNKFMGLSMKALSDISNPCTEMIRVGM